MTVARGRSEDYERQFLEHAAREAGLGIQDSAGFRDRVRERLDRGTARYGDEGFWTHGFDAVVTDAREEAEDIASYVLGAAQVLYDDGVDDDDAHAIRLHLMASAAAALRAWVHLSMAQVIYKDARE